MNKIEQQLNTLSQEINAAFVLKKSERARMLKHVTELGHIPEKMPSPYHVVSFPRIFFMNRPSIALIAVLFCTGIISYGAEKALPGDTLYSVKTQFNENIQSLLTFSPESKAKLEAALAEKRLIEAQNLAASSRLSPDNADQLQQSFQQHSDEFKKSVQEIGQGQPGTAISLSSDFQSALEAHQNVLKTLTSSTTASSTVTDNLTKEISDLDIVRKQAEDSLKNLSSDQIKTLAYDKLGDVSDAIDMLSAVASSTTFSLNDDVAISVETHILNAEAITDQGISFLQAGTYIDAYVYFQTALREIKQADLTIKNTTNLNLSDIDQQKIFGDLFDDEATSTDATSTASTTPVQ